MDGCGRRVVLHFRQFFVGIVCQVFSWYRRDGHHIVLIMNAKHLIVFICQAVYEIKFLGVHRHGLEVEYKVLLACVVQDDSFAIQFNAVTPDAFVLFAIGLQIACAFEKEPQAWH